MTVPIITDEMVEIAARLLANWIGYAWEGLSEHELREGARDWAYNGIGDWQMQGGKPALRRVASKMLAEALASKRDMPT